MEPKTRKFIGLILLPLAFATFMVWLAVSVYNPDYLMRVSFLDVGQGDSIFIQTHQGNQIVIDGGPSSRVLSELGRVMPFFDRSIDLLILTHSDADHVTGLVEILKRYKVKKILLTGVEADTAVYSELERLIERNKIEVIEALQGQRIWLDSATVFDIYWPQPAVEESNLAINDTSIYGKLTFGQSSILFTGDATSRVEDELLPKFNLDADILKVGHHGSKSSTSTQFLQEVTPQYSIIQVGATNTYGHPTPEVLSNLTTSGTTILRTDTDGAINFTSDGINITHQK